jgi:hypothetical protein
VLADVEIAAWIESLGPVSGAGRRGLLADDGIAELARAPRLVDLVRPHLPADPRPVRAIYFDKSADANWIVPWHQDLTLALREHRETAGFGPWSTKDGIPHVQPPAELLGRMLAVRLHLDDSDATNGALRVLPGTHRLGRLSAEDIRRSRAEIPEFLCVARAGDALLMRPLLLHASGKSSGDRHRRVIHIEYAGFALPDGLAWHDGA